MKKERSGFVYAYSHILPKEDDVSMSIEMLCTINQNNIINSKGLECNE